MKNNKIYKEVLIMITTKTITMTNEEAIEMLKQWNEDLSEFDDEKEGIECHKLAISALKKQIPKKPDENRYPWAICPSCGGSVYIDKVQEHIMNNENTYCEHCGQTLDWSDFK